MQMHQNNFKVCLIFNMCKVGILGSSYSVGSHHNKETGENDLALPFETWLEKYTTNMKFFNSACAGKGTELYLNKIVYLKEKHNVDAVLMELVNNRSMLNFKCLPDSYSKIQRTNDMADIEEDVYKTSASAWEYWRALIQDMQEHTFAPSVRAFEMWKDVQWNIASTHNAMEFWGMLDIYQAIKLCKMLNIEVVTWQKSWNFNTLPGFKSMLQKALHVDFEGLNAHQYYSNKYNDPDKILCDHDHFNDCINEEMVRDFIAPKLEKVKKIINIKKASTRVLH